MVQRSPKANLPRSLREMLREISGRFQTYFSHDWGFPRPCRLAFVLYVLISMLLLRLEAKQYVLHGNMGGLIWPLAVGDPTPHPRCLHVATAGKRAACTLGGWVLNI